MAKTVNKTNKVAIIVKGWPRLSETFIAQELLALQEAGLDFDIISLRKPHDLKTHKVHKKIKAKVIYLPEYIYKAPHLLIIAFIKFFFKFKHKKAFWNLFCKTILRDFSANRFRRFAQALIFSNRYGKQYAFIYCHFLHTPCSVGYYASTLLGKEFAFSAHAKDIWTSPEWDIREKVQHAKWGTTCTKYGCEYLAGLSDDPKKMHLIYHGLDFKALPKVKPKKTARKKIVLLSVGRAVEKKGFDLLLHALSHLPSDFRYEWRHIGGGDLIEPLKKQAKDLGVAPYIKWLGAQNREAVFKEYANADLFILPCRIASDGDRDGLPNVLMEASYAGLPIITTPVSGIVECFAHMDNAYFVPENDEEKLVDAIYELGTSKELRDKLSHKAKEKIKKFDFKLRFGDLKKCFKQYLK